MKTEDEARAVALLARSLLPPTFGVAVCRLDGPHVPMLGAEAAVVARAVPKRQREFAVGRAALRLALNDAGVVWPADQPILTRPDRRPDLPPGISTSLSHGGRLCIAIAAPPGHAPVGVDLEAVDSPLPEGMTETVQPFRIRAAVTVPEALIAFCVKEALFKRRFAIAGQMLDFTDAAVVVGEDRFTACVRPGILTRGRWGIAGGHVAAFSLG